MTTNESPNELRPRNIKSSQADRMSSHVGNDKHIDKVDPKIWQTYAQKVKVNVMQQVNEHFNEILDTALAESFQPTVNGNSSSKKSTSSQRMGDRKVFMARPSLLDDLFEINHIRTIYHMFIAVLLIFCMSTLIVDYIDQGRLVLEFDLLFFAFGKPGTVFWAWIVMFAYTLVVPYSMMVFGGSICHNIHHKLELMVGTALIFSVIQTLVLGLLPIYVVVHHQLPPASRFIVILEQIRFLMKTYSFVRETAPGVIKKAPEGGETPKLPTFSSYLYFLFCPTLIYRESYPRNSHIRWKYVGVTIGMILGCLFYGYFILVRLCVPIIRPEFINTVSTRTMVLAVFHSILPGIMLFLLCFFAFLHCWLNLFGELLRFSDRMFYKDWWNSNSFTNYYRTWNVVVHDWLYYYAYKDFLLLSKRKFRTAAMLSVFIISALVHEYALAMGFGFFYPIMLFLFGIFGVTFNFVMNDKRQSPACNVIMWMSLFLGQGVLVCLYSQEWYAQINCPPTGNSLGELLIPRSWSCNHHR